MRINEYNECDVSLQCKVGKKHYLPMLLSLLNYYHNIIILPMLKFITVNY